MTVYAVSATKNDSHESVVYGDLSYINHRYVYMDELDGDCFPEAVKQSINRFADAFDPDRDYLLIAGDHLQLVAASAALGARYSSFKVLRWDRYANGYVPVKVQV